MDGNSHYEKQHPIGRLGAVMLHILQSGETVKVRGEMVEHRNNSHSGNHSEQSLPQAHAIKHLHRGYYKTHNRRSQHHATAITEENVIPLMWYILDECTECRPQ